MAVQPDSFVFRGVDMLATYGVRCISSDPLLPELRPRKIEVPGRDGAYDYGAAHYVERIITLHCDSMRSLRREELREVALLLTAKGPLVLWDEPDKYYIGRIYRQTELRYIGMVGHEFDLTFVCDPFAYGKTVNGPLETRIQYAGTARTPTRIQITNTGNTTITSIKMRVRERRDN